MNVWLIKFWVKVSICLQLKVLVGVSFSGSRMLISSIIIGVMIVFYMLFVLNSFQNMGLLECFGLGLIILVFLLEQGDKQDYYGDYCCYYLEFFNDWFWFYFFVFDDDVGGFWCQFKLGFGVQQCCCQSNQVEDYYYWVLQEFDIFCLVFGVVFEGKQFINQYNVKLYCWYCCVFLYYVEVIKWQFFLSGGGYWLYVGFVFCCYNVFFSVVLGW